ncbi:hypothetical protein SAMN04488483_0885 [Pseudomonas helmanticensis]|uniref:Uncharacterized protein n=1 Tax=Pseudomonas helmanticensis TaxID=1471381 RepID=A0ACD2U1D1_9PSED|nr:hypothetical protein [Pseudomonas helmanticensis]SMQ23304.1 hypothetical protein SAMN04488483_0885 [Pseudomonas helmanticensis]
MFNICSSVPTRCSVRSGFIKRSADFYIACLRDPVGNKIAVFFSG